MKKMLTILVLILMLSMVFISALAENVTEIEVPQPEVQAPEAHEPALPPQMPESQPGFVLDPNMFFDPEWAFTDPNSPYNPNSPFYDPNLTYDPNVPYIPDGWYYGDTGVEGNLLTPHAELTPEELKEYNQNQRNELNQFVGGDVGTAPQPAGDGIDEGIIDEGNFESNLMRSLRVKSNVKRGETVEIGQEIVLTAIPMGYNVNYNLQWQFAKVDENGNVGKFHNVEGANALTFTFRIDEENISYVWRAIIQAIE